MKKPLVYLAQPMGNRLWGEVMAEAKSAAAIVKEYGLNPWCPPIKEDVGEDPWEAIHATPLELAAYWKQDKAALGRADAVISLRGDMVSEGVGFELGLAKYHHEIPTVIVCPSELGRITHLEADYVASDLDEACAWLVRKLSRRKAARRKK